MQHVHLLAFEEAAGFGGAYIDLMHIARVLRERGARVSVARSWSGEAWAPLAEAGVTLLDHRRWDLAVRLTREQRWGVRRRQLVYAAELATQHLGLALKYARWGRRHGVTHVFCNNSYNHSPGAVLAARLIGAECWSYFQGNLLGHNGFRPMMPYVDFGFGVSQHVMAQAANLGFPSTKLDVLYPGVELPSAPTMRTEDSRVRVGMVGMFTHWKGQLQFVEAFAKAAPRAPCLGAWLFGRVVPGQDAYGRRVLGAIDQLGLGDRIRVVSDRSTPETIYPDVDFTVHCSTDPEPFGRVTIEAMSFGRPVVAASIGGPPEVITDGLDGYLVHPLDTDRMAECLVRLANERDVRLEMGEAARRTVETRFSYPAVLEPMLQRLVVS